MKAKQGLVLFAHGSRDPSWARPVRRIAARLRGIYRVEVAYLEHMRPTLEEALGRLVPEVRTVRIVPLFLGAGGHLKRDLPKLVSAARRRHRGVKLVLEKPIGEQPAVLAAIAKAISRR